MMGMTASERGDAVAETVLIVEDDADIVELLSLYLTGSGYEVVSASDGIEGLRALREKHVDVVLADIMMPRMSGYDFIREARVFCDVPIVVVSARTQPADKIVGLDAGADGYISKPFDPLEVTAYIRAMLRRAAAAPATPPASATGATDSRDGAPEPHDQGPTIVVGELAFNTEQLTLTRRGVPIPLTAAELKIMAAFMASPGRVFSKDQLYAFVNGEPAEGGASSVMVHISNIRAKLEDDPVHARFIKTVRGLGYRLDG